MEKLFLIVKLLPALIAAIKAVEDAIPEEGKGEAKLRLVREMLEAVDAGIGALWPSLTVIIASLVRTFNETGAFKKS